ncbi:hypothetical protein G6O69_27095 [Pseudenhygromyxa sp. WMMC2535]|uniref:hypothetical protein n=1 Tax=Pseudenhygromyxa sp. WMMC2535 TaxID=2712867 RepID=UPI001554A846|nr:hypothetical protein [Pseudenhygromyxa sp. WMMC2535]NVB41535.1 hypothetical protein [Pseudenhygromyxa sp. WMMC2535]
MIRTLRRRGPITMVAAALLAGLLGASPAAAWDPSTTHQGLLEAAVTRSAMHLRWMDASELERGLFSDLRVDPDSLAPEQRRLLALALRQAHVDVGARPLGGPGSCPRADAPPETQRFCVDRDLWQQPALGWLRLGMVAEVSPPSRHLHHFVDRESPEALRWSDPELPASTLRARQARSNGEPAAGIFTRTNFSGEAASAIAWLGDTKDLLAPPQTFAHLELASTAPSQDERDQHLALALVGVGALLHVLQDLTVPAHARGDATAFFSPLSPAAGDRGLPLQEFVRYEYGRRDLPGLPPLPSAPPTGEPLATTLIGHVLGEGSYVGVVSLSARRYFSESSVPAPRFLDDTLSASEAASVLLGDDHGLAAAEVDGAVLSPWPAQRGYLLSPTGRALAAFDLDLEGRVRPYLDETCYRDQAARLIPAAAEVSRSLLDLLWPDWPQTQRSGGSLTLTLPAWTSASLSIYVEDEHGERRLSSEHPLTPGGATQVALGEAGGEQAKGSRVVLVLVADRSPGPPLILERVLGDAESFGSTPSPTAAESEALDESKPSLDENELETEDESGLESEADPDAELDPEAAEPDTAEPEAAEPDAAEPDAAEPDAAEPDADAEPGPAPIAPVPL